MEETESQIAKIALGNTKSSNTYVYVMAEKAPVGETELYVVAELPLFNPAAEESCERICLAIASTFKRAYKKPIGQASFENAISQINEELGKLASMGQTNWIYKLNCILGAKEGGNFHIASCGKVSAYLLRNGEFTDISNSENQSHPLKTFENYASGKIRLGDLILLSTTQLFNYISVDRILGIFARADFLSATQTIIQLLKDTSDSQTSFGVLMNLQVPAGQIPDGSIDLEDYVLEDQSTDSFFKKTFNYFKTIFALDKQEARKPRVELPKVSLEEKLKNISGNTKAFAQRSKDFWQTAKTSAEAAKSAMSKEKIKSLSPLKKIFFISALVLFIAVIANIFIAINVSKSRKTEADISAKISNAQALLDKARSSLLYKDYNSAGTFISQAKAILPQSSQVSNKNKEAYEKAAEDLASQEDQMQHQVTVEAENLGSLGQADRLIKLPSYIAVRAGGAVISYNKQTGQIQDNQINTGNTEVLGSTYISGNTSAIYDGANLYVWDFSQNKVSTGFSQSLAAKEDFAGMAFYQTNNRVYVADKKNSRIVNYLSSNTGFSRPTVALTDPILSTAQDITIDGSIYVLTKTGVTKYQAGKLAEFNFPILPTPYSGTGKIHTDKDSINVYVLDQGNNRVIVTDKTGNLIYTLKSNSFTKLTDFTVDEKAKIMYLLNDGSLLKVTLP